MKKTLLIFTIVFSLMINVVHVTAAQEISVVLNGEMVVFDQQPIIQNGRTLIPVRGLFEKLGAEVIWLQNTKEVYIKIEEPFTVNSTLKVGSKNVKTNFRTEVIDVAPTIINNRTYIPLRYISEIASATVHWNNSKKEITINQRPIVTIGNYQLFNTTLYYQPVSQLGSVNPMRAYKVYESKFIDVLLEQELRNGVFTLDTAKLDHKTKTHVASFSIEEKNHFITTYNLLREADFIQEIRKTVRNSLLRENYLINVVGEDITETELFTLLVSKYENEISNTKTEAYKQIFHFAEYYGMK